MIQTQKQESIDKEIVAEQRKELVIYGSQLLRKGLTLWEFNVVDRTLSHAKYSDSVAFLNPKDKIVAKRKVIINKGCIYFQALNLESAKRKSIKLYLDAVKRL